MTSLQLVDGFELLFIALMLIVYASILFGVLGGLGYFILRVRSGGSVDERLDRMERKIGRLEAYVEHLQDERHE
ncbi:hypothetical protein [Haladaptatus salinisoli]|uniref:hypothetical protein n=1 Tax=Haladaptatus salinisoli TaxID=2884876 RepID=UPI001D0AE459|nr:hypothetical protein [Haladaptatus salinisoli]